MAIYGKHALFATAILLYLGSVLVPCASADLSVAKVGASNDAPINLAWKAECPCHHQAGTPSSQNIGSDWQGPPSALSPPILADASPYRGRLDAEPASPVAAPPDRIPIV